MKRVTPWLLGFFVFLSPLAWPASVSQQTKGPCSPAIWVGKGNVRFNCTGVDPASVNLILNLLNTGIPRLEELQMKTIDLLTTNFMDTRLLQQMIAMKYAAVFNASKEDSDKWTKEFFDSAEQKINELKSLAADDKRIAEKFSLQWQPMYNFIMHEFDNRVSELATRNLLKPSGPKPEHKPYYKGTPTRLVIAADEKSDGIVWARDVRFPNGGIIQIFFHQGKVSQGRIVEGARFRWQQSAATLPGDPTSYSFSGAEFIYAGTIHRPKTEDPLADENFRRTISNAIGESIKFIYFHDAAYPAKQRPIEK